jgi:hypothetical protein
MIPILANAGVPMLAIQLPALLAVILPIIAIEAWFLQQGTVVPWRRSLSVSAIANLVSTVIGVPITWFVLFAVQLAVFLGADALGVDGSAQWYLLPFAAPWLPPPEGAMFWWTIAGAALFLSIPYYLVSVYSESWIVCRLEPALVRSDVLRIQRNSHYVTYGLMYLASLGAAWMMI